METDGARIIKTTTRKITIALITTMACLAWTISAQNDTTQERRDVELVVQTGHSGYVTFLRVSPDGKLIASGDQYSLILWDVATARQIRTLKEADPDTDKGIDYTSISFDREWRFLIDGTSLFEVATGRRTATFNTAIGLVGSSVLSGDGKAFAAMDREATRLELWSTVMGKRIHSFMGESLTFSQNGNFFASFGPADKTIRVFSLATGKEISRLANANKPIKMSFASDGTRLVSVDLKGLRVWDIATRKKTQNLDGDFKTIHVATAAYDFDSPARVYFSPAGNSMVAVRDDEIKFWDLESGRITKLAVDDIVMANLGSNGSAFTSDGLTFAGFVPSRDGIIVEMRDVKTGRVVSSFESLGYPNVASIAAAFLPDDRTLAISRANEMDLWDATAGNERKLSRFRRIVHAISNISFGIDGQTLAAGSDDELVDTTGVAGVDITAALNDKRSDAFDDAVLFWRLDGSADPVRFEGALLYSNQFEWNPPDEGIFYHSDHLIGCVKANDQVVCEIREAATGEIKKTLVDYNSFFGGGGDSIVEHHASLSALSADLNRIALSSRVDELEFWDITDPSGFIKGPPVQTGNITSWQLTPKKPVWRIDVEGTINSIVFGPDEKTVVVTFFGDARNVFRATVDAADGKVLEQVEIESSSGSGSAGLDGLGIDAINNGNSVSLIHRKTKNKIAELYWLNRADWAVVTPDGRFDTSLDLDGAQGLHWVIADDPFTPKPLEIFMRQYYEPGLLRRVLKCNEENNCDKEFKPLPSIAEINRVQPKVVLGAPTEPTF